MNDALQAIYTRNVRAMMVHELTTRDASPSAIAAVVAAMLVVPRLNTQAELAAVLGISCSTLRSRFARAGWPAPGASIRLLRALLDIWDCTEAGRSVEELRREGERAKLRGSTRLGKRIKASTGRTIRQWRNDGGFRVALLAVRDALLGGAPSY